MPLTALSQVANSTSEYDTQHGGDAWFDGNRDPPLTDTLPARPAALLAALPTDIPAIPEVVDHLTPPIGMTLPDDWDELADIDKTREIALYRNALGLLHLGLVSDCSFRPGAAPEKKERRRSVKRPRPLPSASRHSERVQTQVRPNYAEGGLPTLPAFDTPRVDGKKKKTSHRRPDPVAKCVRATSATYWFSFPGAPKGGKLLLKSSALPASLLAALGAHLSFLKRTTDDYYHGVTWVHSKKMAEPALQVQIINKQTAAEGLGATRNPIRLGYLPESEILLGGVIVALADIDWRLCHQTDVYAFLIYVSVHGDAAVHYWLEEIGAAIHDVNPKNRTFPGGAPKRSAYALTRFTDGFFASHATAPHPHSARDAEQLRKFDESVVAARTHRLPTAPPAPLPPPPPMLPLP